MKLNESPDTLEFENGDKLFWDSGRSYAFGYGVWDKENHELVTRLEVKPKFGYNTELLISPVKETHHDILRKYDMPEECHVNRDTLIYSGRIWLDKKIISFWEYPKTTRHRKQVVEDLEEMFRIKIIGNPEWVVEVGDREFETATKYASNKDISFAQWKRTQHVKAGRFFRKVPDGVGSETHKFGKLSVSQAHQMMRTSEDKRLRDCIKKIIKEKYYDSSMIPPAIYGDHEENVIYKNPTKKEIRDTIDKSQHKECRGLYNVKTQDIYIWDLNRVFHDYIIRKYNFNPSRILKFDYNANRFQIESSEEFNEELVSVYGGFKKEWFEYLKNYFGVSKAKAYMGNEFDFIEEEY